MTRGWASQHAVQDFDHSQRCDREQTLYEVRKKIYPRAVTASSPPRAGAVVLLTQTGVLRRALAHVERPAGGAVRPRCAQVLHLRPGVLAAGHRLPDRPADHLRVLAVPVHRGGRAAVVRLRLSADGLHRDLHVDRAQGRGRPDGAHEARQAAAVARARSGSRPPSTALWIALALWTGFTFVGLFHADPDAWREMLSARDWGPGRRSGSCSTASRPTATPAGCASRCASTCAPTPASRA